MNNAVVHAPPTDDISVVRFTPFGATEQIELSIEMVKQFLTSPTASGKLPENKDVVKFMMLCKARELNPWEGDAFLVGYDSQKYGAVFSLITSHQAFLKRAEASPEYDGMESGIIVRKNGDDEKEIAGEIVPLGHALVGGWARVFRKDRSHPMYKKLDLKSYEKSYGLWAGTQKVNMIVKCAEADAFRSSFPNKLGNLYIEGERMPVDVVESEQAPSKAAAPAAPKPQATGLKDVLKAKTTPEKKFPLESEPLSAEIESGTEHEKASDGAATNPEVASEQTAPNDPPPYPDSWREDRKQIPKGASFSWEKHTPLVLKAKAAVPEFKESAIYEMRYRLVETYDKPIPADDKLFDELKKAVDERAAASAK